jgi:hypothetical protein
MWVNTILFDLKDTADRKDRMLITLPSCSKHKIDFFKLLQKPQLELSWLLKELNRSKSSRQRTQTKQGRTIVDVYIIE